MKDVSLLLLAILPCWRAAGAQDDAGRPSLDEQLRGEPAATLADSARQSGDPVRGAIVFYQPYLACTKCHTAGEDAKPLGPDLARPGEPVGATHLIEARRFSDRLQFVFGRPIPAGGPNV
ncbi:MAG TPA: hypothetical protein VHY91_01455 [Pirellulales bacterium]|jgi:hypothetical protein|nr:hypothetical protein [Pirellulales bacterium]